MMDLKEIIKWFIPCFHILLANLKNIKLTLFCLFLLLSIRAGCAANVKGVEIVRNDAKNIVASYFVDNSNVSQSDAISESREMPDIVGENQNSVSSDNSVGRTFGRPFKKMMAGMIPLIFQLGAASTWAVVAALVGIKTLAVTLLILKILLVAGAAKSLAVVERAYIDQRRQTLNSGVQPYRSNHKYQPLLQSGSTNAATRVGTTNGTTVPVLVQKFGALFAAKAPAQHGAGWEPHAPQKEIHLHIHSGQHGGHDEHAPPAYGGWSRDDSINVIEAKRVAVDPYPVAGPHTIRTPFGNYVKVEDPLHQPT